MRLRRVRFTVRRMMVAVAISAIAIGAGVWAERMWRYSREFRTHAAAYRVTEQLLLRDGHDREAERFALARRKYEDAARHPWNGLDDDPTPPPSDRSGINSAKEETGAAGDQRQTATVRVTVEILPKPNGAPYQHGEQIRCRGRITWRGVGPPTEIMADLQPGLFPDRGLPIASQAFFRLKVTSQDPDSSSGTAEWEGSIRANHVPGIDDYMIRIVPSDEDGNDYLHAGTPVFGFGRLRIPR